MLASVNVVFVIQIWGGEVTDQDQETQTLILKNGGVRRSGFRIAYFGFRGWGSGFRSRTCRLYVLDHAD